MKDIVVTGAAGFIGSNLIKGLNKSGIYNIVAVDTFDDYADIKNLKELKFTKYIKKDELIDQLSKDTDFKIILHMGACSSTLEKNPYYLFENNTLYSKKLFDYCTDRSIPFIYASSAATYGQGSNGYSDNNFELFPLNLYGLSKHVFDQLVLLSEKKPPQWVGLKFFNVYGPGESHKGIQASMAYHGYNQIKNDGKITLFRSHNKNYKDGEQKRDFIYINDVVDVVNYFASNRNLSGIYNVGTGRARTFLDLTKSIFSTLNIEEKIGFIDTPEQIRKHYQYFTEADISKLRLSGYTKEFTALEDGIRDYVNLLSSEERE